MRLESPYPDPLRPNDTKMETFMARYHDTMKLDLESRYHESMKPDIYGKMENLPRFPEKSPASCTGVDHVFPLSPNSPYEVGFQ